VHDCPYCGRALQWVPHRWFGRGTFECEHCGEFPDLAEPADRRGAPMAAIGEPLPRPTRRHDGRPRVLLVDDSAEYRDLYALMLEQTATVITASRGEDALTIASAQPLDAIVLDVMMPGMDGWQTCERLKASPLTSAIPVIMLTSLDGLDVPETAARLGAAYVLIKPCPVDRLAFAIKAALH
jgi:CheY-like chemotaxis protein